VFTALDDNTVGTPRLATYTIPAPAGGWKATANGSYTISIVNHEIADVFGNYMPAGAVGTIEVQIASTGPDITPPSFTLTPPTGVTMPDSSPATFTITWSDDTQVDFSTIGDGDVLVMARMAMVTASRRRFVSVNSGPSGTVIATYAVAAPAGGWTAASNGNYAILVRANQVGDTSGNFIAAGTFIGSIPVNVTGTSDTTAPSFALTPPAGVTTADSNPATFTITWSDASGVKRFDDRQRRCAGERPEQRLQPAGDARLRDGWCGWLDGCNVFRPGSNWRLVDHVERPPMHPRTCHPGRRPPLATSWPPARSSARSR
jgi:hypothetical protein